VKEFEWSGIQFKLNEEKNALLAEHAGVDFHVSFLHGQFFAQITSGGYQGRALGTTKQTALRRAGQDLKRQAERACEDAKMVLRRYARYEASQESLASRLGR